MAWLKLNANLHETILRRLSKKDRQEAATLRKQARAALKANDFSAASNAAIESIKRDPTSREGINLLLRVQNRSAKLARDGQVEEFHITGLPELLVTLQKLRLTSASKTEALAVVYALLGNPTKAIETLNQLPNINSDSVLSTRLIGLLVKEIDEVDLFHQLWALLDQFGVSHDDDMRDAALRGMLTLSMKFGTSVERVHPLQDPETFGEFTKIVKTGKPAVASFPPQLQTAVASRQVASKRKNGRRAKKNLLIVSDNWNFFSPIAEELEDSEYVVRYLDFEIIRSAFAQSDSSLEINRQTRNLIAKPKPEEVLNELAKTNQVASDLIEWSDVVFCEWFTDNAVWLSRYLPEGKTLIARLHSYEAFSNFPLLANLCRFDGLVFIASHIREIFTSLVGHENLANCTMSVVPNARDLPNLSFAKRDTQAQMTVGMTQYASSNKDPIFALDILQKLKAADPRWRLRFVGNPWPNLLTDKEDEYRHRFTERVAEFGDNVLIEGYTNDIASWYRSVGFVLSASKREGSHESLVEGMLTGAVPALRAWPMMHPFGGPASVFPGISSFDTPEEIAQYILDAWAQFENSSQRAVEYAKQHVDSVDPIGELLGLIRTVSK